MAERRRGRAGYNKALGMRDAPREMGGEGEDGKEKNERRAKGCQNFEMQVCFHEHSCRFNLGMEK